MKKSQFLLACLLTMTLNSCTGVTVYVGKKLVVNEVDDYFDLNDTQEDWLEDKLDSHVDRFRKSTLKDIYGILDRAEKNYDHSFTNEEVNMVIDDFEVLSKKELTILLKDMVTFLSKMDKRQLIEARQRNEKKEKEKQEDLEDNKDEEKKETEKERLAKALENYASWYGSLDKSQENFITELYKKDPSKFHLDIKLSPGADFTTKLAQIFSDETNPELKKTQLESWIKNPELMTQSFNLKSTFDKIRDNQKKFPSIDQIMNEKQRIHFREKIAETKSEVKKYILD